MFFLAPRSVSSVPLQHYRSTARLSPTLRGMQTHIKRGPLVLNISRLCSSYFHPSYLSVSVSRMLVGCLYTHTQFILTNCCPTLCSLGSHREMEVMPPADVSAQVSHGDAHAGQHNNHTPKYGFVLHTFKVLSWL